jgi:hypothetical protein
MLERVLKPYADAGLLATAEALFPENTLGVPDYRTTELVPRMQQYFGLLPARQRRLLLSLFALVELAAPFLVFGFRRFSRLPVGRRERAVRAWRASELGPLRLIGDALKATTTMIYMSHPAALSYVGAEPGCGRATEPIVE